MNRDFDVEWAGYGNDGNDRHGHLHPHKDGPFYRSDGMRGYYCCAPLNGELMCSDPPVGYLTVPIGSNPDKGGQFMFLGESHEIIGFYNGKDQYLAYTFTTDSDGLEFVHVWEVYNNTFIYRDQPGFTVLDAVNFMHLKEFAS